MGDSLKANLAIGICAGLAGTALMGAFFAATKKLAPASGGTEQEEPTTNKVATRVLNKAGVRYPSRKVRNVGGQVVHWTYGAAWGALAGLARSAGVRLAFAGGQPLGAGLWAAGDVWLLYKIGLARHPREYPKSVHAQALGAHLAYGLGVWSTFALAHQLRRRMAETHRRAA